MMKRIAKFLSVILVLSLCFGIAAGCKDNEPDAATPTKITITGRPDDDTLFFVAAGTHALDYTIEPAEAFGADVTWTSSDTTVATMSTVSGVKVRMLKVGTTTITATVTGTDVKDSFVLNIVAAPTFTVELNGEEKTSGIFVTGSSISQSMAKVGSDNKSIEFDMGDVQSTSAGVALMLPVENMLDAESIYDVYFEVDELDYSTGTGAEVINIMSGIQTGVKDYNHNVTGGDYNKITSANKGAKLKREIVYATGSEDMHRQRVNLVVTTDAYTVNMKYKISNIKLKKLGADDIEISFNSAVREMRVGDSPFTLGNVKKLVAPLGGGANLDLGGNKAAIPYNYTSSDNTVATFADPGSPVITAVKAGTVTITATVTGIGATLMTQKGYYEDSFTVNPPNPAAPVITPSSRSFDKYGPQDVSFTVTLTYDTFTKVMLESTDLILNTDYTFSGGQLTLKAAYLSALAVDTHSFTLVTENFAATSFSVIVSDTTPPDGAPVIESHSRTIDKKTLVADVDFIVTLKNGDTFTKISKNSADLTADTDYTFTEVNPQPGGLDVGEVQYTLTVKESYIMSLSEGLSSFTLVTANYPTGAAFSITVNDTRPPSAANKIYVLKDGVKTEAGWKIGSSDSSFTGAMVSRVSGENHLKIDTGATSVAAPVIALEFASALPDTTVYYLSFEIEVVGVDATLNYNTGVNANAETGKGNLANLMGHFARGGSITTTDIGNTLTRTCIFTTATTMSTASFPYDTSSDSYGKNCVRLISAAYSGKMELIIKNVVMITATQSNFRAKFATGESAPYTEQTAEYSAVGTSNSGGANWLLRIFEFDAGEGFINIPMDRVAIVPQYTIADISLPDDEGKITAGARGNANFDAKSFTSGATAGTTFTLEIRVGSLLIASKTGTV